MKIKRYASYCLVLCYLIHKGDCTTSVAGKLYTKLFKDYNIYAPPNDKNHTHPVYVNYGFEISQILEVADREQTIQLKAWVRQRWVDENLQWNPKDWNNITNIVYDPNLIWLPDIVLYNNANEEDSFGADFYKNDVTIRYDGFIEWNSPVIFKSMCKLDIRYFPYDQHTCFLKFGSWIYDTSIIKLTEVTYPIIVANNYFNSSQWDVVRAWSENKNLKYDCCVFPYSETTIHLTIKRKPLYYTFNIITPCLVLVINIFIGFYLPPDCGERVGLTMTILLAVAVFLQMVSDTLPRNSDNIPILGLFYIIIMIESSFSLVTTCIVLITYQRGIETHVKPIPKWLKRVFIDCIGKWLNIKRDNGKDNSVKYNHHAAQQDEFNDIKEVGIINKSYNELHLSSGNVHHKKKKVGDKTDQVIHEIQVIRSLMLKTQVGNEDEEVQDEWKYLAKILDRFFFWLLFTTVVGTSCALLLPAYYYHQ